MEFKGKAVVVTGGAQGIGKCIDDCSYEEFAYAQAVGVAAPFYLAKLFKGHFAKGASIINISSSRDRMSQPQTESYTASEIVSSGGIGHGALAGLLGENKIDRKRETGRRTARRRTGEKTPAVGSAGAVPTHFESSG